MARRTHGKPQKRFTPWSTFVTTIPECIYICVTIRKRAITPPQQRCSTHFQSRKNNATSSCFFTLLGIVQCCINRFHFIMPILSTAMETMETQPRMTMVFGVDVHPPCVMRHVRHVWTCVHHHAHTSRVGGVVVLVMSSPNNDPSHLWFIHSINHSFIHITSATLFGWWGARGLDGGQVAVLDWCRCTCSGVRRDVQSHGTDYELYWRRRRQHWSF